MPTVEECNRLVVDNIKYAYRLAWKFWKQHGSIATKYMTYDDASQVAVVALIKASRRYEPGKAKFTTFAYYVVRQELLDEYRSAGVIRVPTHACAAKVRSVKELHSEQFIPVKSDSDGVKRIDASDEVESILRGLPEKDCQMLSERWGLKDGVDKSLSEVARNRGCSLNNVSREHQRIFKGLRYRLGIDKGEKTCQM
jgi:RNA polymerase sigma factor (sigma-70 family)